MPRLLMVAFTAMLVAGCSTEPMPSGRFVLTRIGAEALPAAISPGSPQTTIADTALFINPHSVRHRFLFSLNGVIRQGDVIEELADSAGLLVSVPPRCPDNALCVYSPHTIRFFGDSLRIDYTGTLKPQLFVRR